MRESEGVVTDDAWLASYLITRGAHLGEPIVSGRQVTFRVVGPEVEADAERFVRGQAIASVHALKSGMQLARDYLAAAKRGGGRCRGERESARRGTGRGKNGSGAAQG